MKKWQSFTIGLLTLVVLGNGMFYVLGFSGAIKLHHIMPRQGPFLDLLMHFQKKVWEKEYAFLLHVLGGMLALALGPFQFWQGLRERRPGLHRALGYGYFTGILVGGVSGLLSARLAWAGLPARIGFAVLAALWLGVAGLGFRAILGWRIQEHQSWMRLSYGLTLAAISLRLQMPMLLAAGLSEENVYRMVAWSCWVPQAAWWIVWGRGKAFGGQAVMGGLFKAGLLLALLGAGAASWIVSLEPKRLFPKGMMDDFNVVWYSEHLDAMDEKPLGLEARNPDSSVYRLLWLGSFSHPLMIRFKKTSTESGELHIKELDGAGGYRPGKIIKNIKRSLSKQELAAFFNEVEKSGFWKLPVEVPSGGMDGAQWIWEGCEGGKYHVVDRWSPGKGEYYKSFLRCFKMSGVTATDAELD